MKVRGFLLAACIASISWCHPVFALKVIEKDGFYIYYPENTSGLARRLADWCPAMAAFLEGQGLPVNKPIHVVLDAQKDIPGPTTELFPHREIRLPMRAPGVLEDGYTEADPWRYFLFKGLGLLGIFNERSGLPARIHRVFGEIISPNTILPEWAIDGISHLLYEHYELRRVSDPMAEAVFAASAIPDLDKVSNHPEIWPGRFSYRIYGRPFIRWLYERYGWERLLLFLQLHGRGILPLEIDIKASRVFGQSWSRLWQIFQARHIPLSFDEHGISIEGYWDPPTGIGTKPAYFPASWRTPGVAAMDLWIKTIGYGSANMGRTALQGCAWNASVQSTRLFRSMSGTRAPVQLR